MNEPPKSDKRSVSPRTKAEFKAFRDEIRGELAEIQEGFDARMDELVEMLSQIRKDMLARKHCDERGPGD
jgi:hypothetical protein